MNITENLSIKWRHVVDEKSPDKLYFATTECVIESLYGEYKGVAKCSSKDSFVKREGRKLSLIRALKNSDLNKQTRTEIWNTLRKKGVKL